MNLCKRHLPLPPPEGDNSPPLKGLGEVSPFGGGRGRLKKN